MKLTFRKLALLGLSLVAMFVLVGCTDKTTTTTGSGTTIGLTDTQKVQAVLDGISLGDISSVTDNLTLPMASVNGVSLSWSTADADIVTALGEITVPSFTDGDKTVKLTLTATLNAVSLTKEFNVTVKAETANEFLTRVANGIIITGSDSIIASFTLPSTLQGVTITWTSSNPTYASIAEAVDNAGLYKVTISRPIIEDGGVNTSITLTGTMTIGDATKEITKDIRVLSMNEVNYMTVLEASEQPDDAAVMFKGIVTAVLGGSAFVQDETGGIYLYNVGSSNLSKLVVGNELEVVGKIDIYGGFIEVIGFSTLEVLSTGNDLPDALNFDLVDVDAITAAQGSIANMTQLKLKALVPATTVGTSVYFALTDGINDVNIKVDKYIDDVIEAQIHTLLAGLTLNDTFKLVNIPIAVYEGAGQFYLTNPSQLVVLSDAEKLAADKQMLSIPLNTFSEGEITLPLSGIGGSVITWAVTPEVQSLNTTTGVVLFPAVSVDTVFTFTATITKGSLTAETKAFDVTAKAMTSAEKVAADKADLTVVLTAKEYDDVTLPVIGSKGSTIAWSVDGNATFVSPKLSYNYNDGVAYNVTLTATISSGDASDTKEFTVAVSPIVFTSIAEMYGTTVAIGDVVAIKGRLTGGTTNSAYWIQDATNGLNIYVPSAMRTAFAAIPVGSEIVLIGKKNVFKGLYEIEQLTKYVVLDTTPELPAFTSIDEVAFNNTDLLPFQGKLVSFAGFTVKTAAATVDANGTYQMTLQDLTTSREIVVRLDYRVANYIAAKDQILTFTVGQSVDVVGAIMNWYDNYQLSIFSASHVVAHVASPAEIAAADVAAVTVDANVDPNEVVTLPSTSNTSTIVWTVGATETNASITDNVVTFADATATVVVTLTATFTYGSGETAIETVKSFDVTIVVLTPAEKLAADKDGITVALTATELSTITLPTTTTYGTVVTWALTETVNASLATNVLTLNYLGSEYSVVVTANLVLGELTDSKEFTIVVSPLVVVTDISTLNAKTSGSWTIVNNEYVYVKGIVIGQYVTYGTFIQDAQGNGIYAYGVKNLTVGDEVIVYGKLAEYKSVRELDSSVLKVVVSTGNAVTNTPLTLVELESVDYEDAGRLVNVTGLTIDRFDGNFVYLNWKTVETVEYYLRYYYTSAQPWLIDLYNAGDTLPNIGFIMYNYNSSTIYDFACLDYVLTDAMAVEANKGLLPSSLELTEDYVIPTAKYSATITITEISSELTSYLTTAGVVTLPATDAVGTITFTVSKGLVSETVTIPVTVKAVLDTAKVASAKAELIAEYDNLKVLQNTIMDLVSTDSKYDTVITWASNNALVNATTGAVGSVTEPTAVVLTATITKNAASDTVDLNISVEVSLPVVVTASYTGTTTTNMAASPANNATIIGLDSSLFTVTSSKGSASNEIGLNSAGQIRLYAYRTDGNGNTLSISIGSGYTITQVKFVFGASTNNPTATLMLGDANNSLISTDLINVTKTFSDLSVQSFSLKNTQTGGTSNAQIYVLSVEITYIQN